MSKVLLENIEAKIDLLIERCAKLEQEAEELRRREESWQRERRVLIDKNAKARTRVEAMITHLKNLSNSVGASST